jgi:predicted nucleic acid-binding protein
MATKILIDTNIILDYLLTRDPFYEDAKQIITSCVNGKLKGCVAAHSINNIFFILRKEYSVDERKKLLLYLCTIFDIEGIDRNKILAGLKNDDFSDFEDCLQMECAKTYGAEYIITRNIEDYKNSEIKVITAKDFVSHQKLI